MKLIPMTKDEIMNHSEKEYNPAEWRKIIERFAKYGNVQFYIESKDTNKNSYNRFYAVYTIPEGIRFLNEVSYSSCLSNRGFCLVIIDENGSVITREFSNGEKTGRLENCKQNRKIMAERSKQFGAIYSNCI